MKKKLFYFFIFLSGTITSQVKISDNPSDIIPNKNATLHIVSTKNKGVMFPKISDITSLPYYNAKSSRLYDKDPTYRGTLSFVKKRMSFMMYEGSKWVDYPKETADFVENFRIARFVMKQGTDEASYTGRGVTLSPSQRNTTLRFSEDATARYALPLYRMDEKIKANNNYNEFEVKKAGIYTIATKIYGHDFIGNVFGPGDISILINGKPVIKETYQVQDIRLVEGTFINDLLKALPLVDKAVENDCVALLRTTIILKENEKVSVKLNAPNGNWGLRFDITFGLYKFQMTAGSYNNKTSELIFIYNEN